jgi:hypothetical protein
MRNRHNLVCRAARGRDDEGLFFLDFANKLTNSHPNQRTRLSDRGESDVKMKGVPGSQMSSESSV